MVTIRICVFLDIPVSGFISISPRQGGIQSKPSSTQSFTFWNNSFNSSLSWVALTFNMLCITFWGIQKNRMRYIGRSWNLLIELGQGWLNLSFIPLSSTQRSEPPRWKSLQIIILSFQQKVQLLYVFFKWTHTSTSVALFTERKVP